MYTKNEQRKKKENKQKRTLEETVVIQSWVLFSDYLINACPGRLATAPTKSSEIFLKRIKAKESCLLDIELKK